MAGPSFQWELRLRHLGRESVGFAEAIGGQRNGLFRGCHWRGSSSEERGEVATPPAQRYT